MTNPRRLVFVPLTIPSPVSVDAAHAALVAIASMSGQPRIILEATGNDHQVRWKLGAPHGPHQQVIALLATHLPGLRAEQATAWPDGQRADTVTALRIRRPSTAPSGVLAHEAVEPVIRGILGALAAARAGERLYLQLVLGPRRAPHSPPAQRPAHRTRAAAGVPEFRFRCDVRIAASTRHPARSRHLVNGLVGAVRALNSPDARIGMTGASVARFSRAQSPWWWATSLSVSEVVALTGWPIGRRDAPPLPGVPSRHPKLLPATSGIPRTGRPLGRATVPPSRPVAISVQDSLAGIAITGPTGVGKSTLLAQLALADIAAGRGTVVIDPKGDLIDAILARADETRLDDIAVLDATDPAPIGINGLVGAGNPDLAADSILGVFHSMWADAWGPRTQDVLHASLLTLARHGNASIVMLPLLLTNPGFRRSIIGTAMRTDPMGLGGFWAWWNSLSDAEQAQATAPLLRRVRPILLRPGLRGILGQRSPKFDLADIFTKRRILLVSLEKGKIGPEAAALLGSLVVSQLWTHTLARATIAPKVRQPVTILIDEVQDYLRLPGDLGDALAQARGLGVGYTLAHQHLGQLPTPLRHAVTANVRSRIVFQLSHPDAREFARLTSGQLEPADFEALPAYQTYAQILHHNTPSAWVSVSTTALPRPVRSPKIVRRRSQSRYGQPLDDVEADLLSLTEHPTGREPLGRIARTDRDRGAR